MNLHWRRPDLPRRGKIRFYGMRECFGLAAPIFVHTPGNNLHDSLKFWTWNDCKVEAPRRNNKKIAAPQCDNAKPKSPYIILDELGFQTFPKIMFPISHTNGWTRVVIIFVAWWLNNWGTNFSCTCNSCGFFRPKFLCNWVRSVWERFGEIYNVLLLLLLPYLSALLAPFPLFFVEKSGETEMNDDRISLESQLKSALPNTRKKLHKHCIAM